MTRDTSVGFSTSCRDHMNYTSLSMSIARCPSASIFDSSAKAGYSIGLPESNTSLEVVLPLDLDGQIENVRHWLSGKHDQELCLQNISLEELERLESRFCEEGLKLR
jgi:hypothetical protein